MLSSLSAFGHFGPELFAPRVWSRGEHSEKIT